MNAATIIQACADLCAEQAAYVHNPDYAFTSVADLAQRAQCPRAEIRALIAAGVLRATPGDGTRTWGDMITVA